MALEIRVNNKTNYKKAKYIAIIAKNLAGLKGYEFYKDHQVYIQKKIKEKKNTILTFHWNAQIWDVVLILESKENQSYQLEAIRKVGNQLINRLNGEQASVLTLINPDNGIGREELLAFLEGIRLSNYQFLKYKTSKKANSLKKVEILANQVNTKEVNELVNVLESTELARNLVNEPVIELNAVGLSKEITKAGKKSGFTVKVLNKSAIQKLKMGGLLGVNKGSIDPPTFNILEWKPQKPTNQKPIVLVGKGVVYDTGGNNIKTAGHMATMKSDMGGAAAVIGTMNAVAKNKLPLHVIGLIPATDNRIGGNALVADDVIRMYDGTTVEVLNTDAEGRLILADALGYAKKYKPELVIDLATLTGAAAAIVGSFGSAMMGKSSDKHRLELTKSGDKVYERVAEMPYWNEYGDLIKSNVADIKNLGGPVGGAMTAGKFLEHFTDYPWIHLDIAGPAFIDKAENYKPAGGTGVGVRLLYNFLKSKSQK